MTGDEETCEFESVGKKVEVDGEKIVVATEGEGSKVDVGKKVAVGGAMTALTLQLPSMWVLTAGSAKLATSCSGE